MVCLGTHKCMIRSVAQLNNTVPYRYYIGTTASYYIVITHRLRRKSLEGRARHDVNRNDVDILLYWEMFGARLSDGVLAE